MWSRLNLTLMQFLYWNPPVLLSLEYKPNYCFRSRNLSQRVQQLQTKHTGESASLDQWRYALKHPCPDKNWVRKKCVVESQEPGDEMRWDEPSRYPSRKLRTPRVGGKRLVSAISRVCYAKHVTTLQVISCVRLKVFWIAFGQPHGITSQPFESGVKTLGVMMRISH